MILEWSRLVAAEVTAGRSGGSYGLIFAWHRGGAVGICDDLAVFLSGEVRASSCGWGDEVRGRLAVEPLARLYGWFDNLAPFQEGSEESTEREPRSLPAGLRRPGPQAGDAGEIAAMRAFAPELHRELAARRPGTAAVVAEADGEASTEANTEKLLVPPEAAVGGRPAAAIPAEVVVPPTGALTPAPLPAPPARPRERGEKQQKDEDGKDSRDEKGTAEETPPPA